MIKLIATDMDGTFLDNSHKITNTNMEAVDFVRNNGIEFVIATGRAFYEAIHPMKEANLKCDIICFNGGVTYDKEGNLLNLISLDPKDSFFIAQIFKAAGVSYQLYTKNKVYTSNIENDVQAYVDLIEGQGGNADKDRIMTEAKARQEQGYLVETDNVDIFINEEDNPVIKIIGISSDKEKLAVAKRFLEENSNLSVTSSGESNLEVMNKNATKGNALKSIASIKNIEVDEIMALGDNLNDLSMLEFAKYSVAMKNGNENIKKVAKYISELTNNESGVGDMIYKIIREENGIK
ncbi:HAD family hydrolase [Gemella sp. GH3]|uniref:HAD family hydrolase n=1 Tax=unclassified Gemella TaxID=2624949 RepID=UPI0015CF9112|nr:MULTISPECIES: HAD family hydrolase [unclassified Gemella]MBF0714056.1 HAD family hydrolase [Gemella sp. GH3.1]NYS51008.1 HAD family hydrolase [Gemella sp. GH3]